MNSRLLRTRIDWAMKNGKGHRAATVDSYREIQSEYSGERPHLSRITKTEKGFLRDAKLIRQKKGHRRT